MLNLSRFFGRRAESDTTRGHIAYLGEPADIAGQLPDNTIGIVLGQLVVMAVDEPPHEITNTFIPQPKRLNHRTDFSLKALQQKAVALNSSIHPLLAQQIETLDKARGIRFVLAVDAICKLAQRYRRRKSVVICNGYEASEQTYFDIYIFHHGLLIKTIESMIKPASHVRYAMDVRQQLDSVLAEYPGAKVVWTAPLSQLDLPGYDLDLVGPEIYEYKFPPVMCDGRTTPPNPKIPAIATAAVVVGSLAVGALDVSAFVQKRQTYDQLTMSNADTLSAPIEILKTRADWERGNNTDLVDKRYAQAKTLFSIIAAHPEWRVQSISLKTQAAGDASPVAAVDTPSISMTLITPSTAGRTPTEQAHGIVDALHNASGMQLTVRQQGITTISEAQLRITIDID